MWVTLIITILTYLMSSRDTAAQRRSALIRAAAVGAGTWAVTNYTDWGQENLAPIDDTISGWLDPTPDPNATQTGSGGTTDNLWSTLKAWGPKGIATVAAGAGAGLGLATGSSTWIWIAVAGVGAILLLRK